MKEEILKMRAEGLTLEEMGKVLGKSKSTMSYYCKKFSIKVDKIVSEETKANIKEYYKSHSKKETAEYFGVSEATVKRYGGRQRLPTISPKKRRQNNVKLVMAKRRELKTLAIEYKGGCCEVCGYNKSTWALDFHHRNPEEKDFNISRSTYSWDRLKPELDKCILVCRNCHAEIHEKIYIEA